jgi:branched-chain amino acid transport system ATP-binding protein
LLKVENLNTFYGEIKVLDNIQIDVSEGQIVSIIGANGAGKSTLINTISGITPCKSGEIEFLEQRIEHLPPNRIVKLGLVQVPENRLLFSYMSVEENLELGCYIPQARIRRKENLGMVFEIFPILQERKKQSAMTLSGGEQQMLAIARALMSQPKLLMFDEPSLGLGPIIVARVFEIIQQIHRQGVSILLVEQNMKRALSISDKGYVLESGRIPLEGTGEELLTNEHVKKAYLGI